MPDDDHNQPPIFVYYERRPSTDRLAGLGTPTSGRYFQSYSEQVVINMRLHSRDHDTIHRAMSWAKGKGYLSAEE